MHQRILRLLYLACFVAVSAAASGIPLEQLKLVERDGVTVQAVMNKLDEAIPLGNGLLGGLLWGSESTIRLSLDRGDLWDTRVPEEFNRQDFTWKTMQRLVAEKNQAAGVPQTRVSRRACWMWTHGVGFPASTARMPSKIGVQGRHMAAGCSQVGRTETG